MSRQPRENWRPVTGGRAGRQPRGREDPGRPPRPAMPFLARKPPDHARPATRPAQPAKSSGCVLVLACWAGAVAAVASAWRPL